MFTRNPFILQQFKALKKQTRNFILLIVLFVTVSMMSAIAKAEDGTEGHSSSLPAMVNQDLFDLSIEDLLAIQVTSLPSGSEKELRRSSAMISVITTDMIRGIGATSIEDVLNTVPGVHAGHSGEVYAEKIAIRGIVSKFNSQVLFMVNGVPVKDHLKGGLGDIYDIGSIPVEFVEKIEVLRGPGSAQFGADAFAGVVNIVTKSGIQIAGGHQQSTTVAGLGYGSFNTARGWVMTGYSDAQFEYSIMANYDKTDGHRREIAPDAEGKSGSPDLDRDHAHLLMELRNNKWKLRGQYIENNSGVGQGVADSLSPTSKSGGTWGLLELRYENEEWSRDWGIDMTMAATQGSQFWSSNDVLNATLIGNPSYKGRDFRSRLIGTYNGLKSQILRLGAEYFYDSVYQVNETKNFDSKFDSRGALVDVSGTSEAFLPTVKRHSGSVFVQDEWKISENHELTIGLRVDRQEQYGTSVNPRISHVWSMTNALTSKFLYGHAFRAPNFVELYVVNNPVTLGNPDLNPETIDVYEIGLNYLATANLNLAANVYIFNANNMIFNSKDPGGTTSSFKNASEIEGTGLELESQFKPTRDLILTANYTMQSTLDKETRKDFGGTPEHKIYLREEWKFTSNMQFNSQITVVGDRPREPVDSRDKLAGYTKVDVSFVHDSIFDSSFSFKLGVQNLFDADVRDPSAGPDSLFGKINIPNDLPQAGRNITAKLTYQF